MNRQAHFYVIIACVILGFFFVVYGFVYDHKEHITTSDNPNKVMWTKTFVDQGMPEAIIDDISHDEDTWYYNGISTCVAYGDWNDRCIRNEVYCGGKNVVGTPEQQAQAVVEALRNGGMHPMCPLLYQGAS